MSKVYELEIKNYLNVITNKDDRIKQLTNTIKKALKMMQHPRLMQLIMREVKYDRFEYTWQKKLEITKQEIDLTEKEEREINEQGVYLCPQTFKELYQTIRDSEKEVLIEN